MPQTESRFIGRVRKASYPFRGGLRGGFLKGGGGESLRGSNPGGISRSVNTTRDGRLIDPGLGGLGGRCFGMERVSCVWLWYSPEQPLSQRRCTIVAAADVTPLVAGLRITI
jgi:hypothetical protein